VSMKTANVHVHDMAGIEKLHRQDVAATLSGDLDVLESTFQRKNVRGSRNER
jgi:hypothetical protein